MVPVWLFSLLFAVLVLYTDDYVIAGILPEIARDLGVSEAQAGQLVTVFSLTVALFAPLAAVTLMSIPRRVLFSASLIVFALANLAASLTPSFAALMSFRVAAALAAGAMAPAVFAFAADRAPEGRTGRFIAVIALGVTGSIAVGVPLGTSIGGALGWRATFLAMAIAGCLALLLILITLPAHRVLSSPPRLVEQLRVLLQVPILAGLIANCVLMTGSMMLLTYLAPYLAAATTAGVDERAIAFGLAGAAGMLGVWAGGEATDRLGADRTLMIGIAVFVMTMLGLWVLWRAGPSPFPLVVVVTSLWGAAAFWNSPAIQARLFQLAGPLAPQALALNTSATYLGVAAGGALGGAVLSVAGPGALPVIAAVVGALALGILALAGGTITRSHSASPSAG